MTLLEAIVEVLRKVEEPLHAKELTRQVLTRGLWRTSGKTPEATIAARPDAIPVGLMKGEQLVLLLAEHEIVISRQSHDLFDLGEEE